MFYSEYEPTDLIIGDPLQEDAIFLKEDENKDNGKEPGVEKNSKEEGEEEAEAAI